MSLAEQKPVLHVGSGAADPDGLHRRFRGPGWREVRLDIEPQIQHDLVVGMRDLSMIPFGDFGALHSSPNLEPLEPHEVPLARREFACVLEPDGFVLITGPDLRAVAVWSADGKLEDVADTSPADPIGPLDMVYVHRASPARGDRSMAQCTGFTQRTLGPHLVASGLARALVRRDPPAFALWALAYKAQSPEAHQPPATVAAPAA